MFGRRQRQEERLYWEGFRDALVRGHRNPGQPECGLPIAERPRYPRGFEDGRRAAKRIHRDALVSEVRKLSLAPGDALVLKLGKSPSAEALAAIKDNLEPRFPGNQILVCDSDVDLSVVKLDGKVVAEAVARTAKSEAARA